MPVDPINSSFATLTYPRTGKRGVPQQFPRRLYEMLEGESKLAKSDAAEEASVISWSESGKAFRILDVDIFATTVLPRYFRTKKFSSFQRNLNLYGFAKVRRGPETDMYAHPAFVRGQPETLSQLRKISSSSRRRLTSKVSPFDDNDASGGNTSDIPGFRSVSPSPPRGDPRPTSFFPPLVEPSSTSRVAVPTCPTPTRILSQTWITINGQSLAPKGPPTSAAHRPPETFPAPPESNGTGRLDLLALALEREGCFAN